MQIFRQSFLTSLLETQKSVRTHLFTYNIRCLLLIDIEHKTNTVLNVCLSLIVLILTLNYYCNDFLIVINVVLSYSLIPVFSNVPHCVYRHDKSLLLTNYILINFITCIHTFTFTYFVTFINLFVSSSFFSDKAKMNKTAGVFKS